MNLKGPYVSVAAICEVLLHEQDDRLSCIRFFDVLNVQVAAGSPEPLPAIQLRVNALIAFKSGEFVGTKNCVLRLESPSGKTGKLAETSPKSYPMIFKGQESGYNLKMALDIPVTESGLYWFDVLLDDELYTRIPLRLNITRTPPSQPDSENNQQALDHQA